MSHFYGTLKGARGEATRTGSKGSGMTAVAAGWGGAIETRVYQDADGIDRYAVYLTPWQGSSGTAQCIAAGVLDANAQAPTP